VYLPAMVSRTFWRSLALAISLLWTTAGTARAAEKAGVRMADTMTVRGQNLVLNGMGVREATIFNVDVYVAGLYVTQRTSDPAAILRGDQPKVLHLVFVHDVDRAKISDAWSEGFEKNAGSRLAALHDRVEQLKGAMVDLRPGSTLTFAYAPEHGVEVTVNGVSKLVISGQDFAEAFFTIWFGSNPPNRGLKSGLLGR
jgi:hypothetical protein